MGTTYKRIYEIMGTTYKILYEILQVEHKQLDQQKASILHRLRGGNQKTY